MKFCVILIIMTIVGFVKPANILSVYPCPSISHQVVFRPLTLELLKRGHRMTVITPDPMYPKGGHKNLTEIDVHDISYSVIKKYLASHVTGSKSDLINQVKGIMDLISISFEEQMKTEEVQNVINNNNETYDLILIEAIYVQALAISHVIKAPTILISSFGMYLGIHELMGIPTHPILYHSMFRQRLYNLTLLEKAKEVYNQIVINYEVKIREEKENEVLKNIFGPDTPPISVLKNYVDLLFVNLHPIWEGNHPVPPNVVYMGGLQVQARTPKTLPQDLQQLLDSSENGVIYFSFGTNVNLQTLLPPEKIQIFENVFSQLPYNVIWRRDNDRVVIKSDNIKVYQWVPQADLLRHRNVKLFITQGGLQSTDEAIIAGVPLLGVPLLADQWYNVEKYIKHGIGQKVDFEDITEYMLKNAILEVAEGEKYKKNIVRLRSLMADQPEAPLQRAIWWIDYVLRHGGAKHLRAPIANITWTEFLQLDLIMFIAFVTVSIPMHRGKIIAYFYLIGYT
ncbi:PREDICTED: UDP-glucuronosyltransferase 2B7-like [Papilio polytes]|uniref:UDP-glucuronosyltransferase 2B7-like n=1 Tax=Papilio polytes TaxID=76194 RepID=UPI00067630C6|nr:PREDICTED: UDP-glucuronosyltransferase 2B7-like [Papilio polytes]